MSPFESSFFLENTETTNDTLQGSVPPHPIVFGPDPEWWKFGQRAKLRREIRRLEK